jgi:hypothetical protein
MGSPRGHSGTSWAVAMAHERPSRAHRAHKLWARNDAALAVRMAQARGDAAASSRGKLGEAGVVKRRSAMANMASYSGPVRISTVTRFRSKKTMAASRRVRLLPSTNECSERCEVRGALHQSNPAMRR